MHGSLARGRIVNATSMTWRAEKRTDQHGTWYTVVSENGIRVTPYGLDRLAHARVLATLVQGTPDDAGDMDPAHKLAILRVFAILRAVERWSRTDRSRSHADAVASWNRFVPTARIFEADGRVECTDATHRMLGWRELPGILPLIAEGGAS